MRVSMDGTPIAAPFLTGRDFPSPKHNFLGNPFLGFLGTQAGSQCLSSYVWPCFGGCRFPCRSFNSQKRRPTEATPLCNWRSGARLCFPVANVQSSRVPVRWMDSTSMSASLSCRDRVFLLFCLEQAIILLSMSTIGVTVVNRPPDWSSHLTLRR